MLAYFFVRFFGWTISCLPYSAIHAIGRITGSMVYYVYTPFRKKAMSNLAIAYGSQKSETERKKIARQSFQNLMITCLEFFRLKKKDLKHMIKMIDPEKVISLQEKGQGIVFMSGHQANWEIPFLCLNMLSPDGIAVGRPIKNPRIYKWIMSVRQMNGGRVVMPRQAIKEGLKALRAGKYIGIVADQAFPESDYSFPLFGTRAWSTTAPALLAYKTHSPIIVGTSHRMSGYYEVRGSSPIWPNYNLPMKECVIDLMDRAYTHLEQSIKGSPDQWMWIHDRWKQQGIDHVKRIYRYGFILIIVPNDEPAELRAHLKEIYPHSFLTFMTPEDDLTIRDWRYQLVLDFVGLPKVRRHFRKLGAVRAIPLTLKTMKQTLVKPECLHTVSF